MGGKLLQTIKPWGRGNWKNCQKLGQQQKTGLFGSFWGQVTA